jgi:hypothetical protein
VVIIGASKEFQKIKNTLKIFLSCHQQLQIAEKK